MMQSKPTPSRSFRKCPNPLQVASHRSYCLSCILALGWDYAYGAAIGLCQDHVGDSSTDRGSKRVPYIPLSLFFSKFIENPKELQGNCTIIFNRSFWTASCTAELLHFAARREVGSASQQAAQSLGKSPACRFLTLNPPPLTMFSLKGDGITQSKALWQGGRLSGTSTVLQAWQRGHSSPHFPGPAAVNTHAADTVLH